MLSSNRPVMTSPAGGMLTQAEEGMKLFAAQNGAAAEIDKAAAETYKADIEARTSDSICALSPGFGHFASYYRMIRIDWNAIGIRRLIQLSFILQPCNDQRRLNEAERERE